MSGGLAALLPAGFSLLADVRSLGFSFFFVAGSFLAALGFAGSAFAVSSSAFVGALELLSALALATAGCEFALALVLAACRRW